MLPHTSNLRDMWDYLAVVYGGKDKMKRMYDFSIMCYLSPGSTRSYC